MLEAYIPLRIKPVIDDYKLVRGKKFKRSLPKREMFVFGDPKRAGEFYGFINTKFGLDDDNVYNDVPFVINGQSYFLSFYKVEIQDQTLILAPWMFNLVVNSALGYDDPLENYERKESVYRKCNWYIAIEVYNDLENDCLA